VLRPSHKTTQTPSCVHSCHISLSLKKINKRKQKKNRRKRKGRRVSLHAGGSWSVTPPSPQVSREGCPTPLASTLLSWEELSVLFFITRGRLISLTNHLGFLSLLSLLLNSSLLEDKLKTSRSKQNYMDFPHRFAL
jgi:hypothetical protein